MSFTEKLDMLMAERRINKSILSKEADIPYTTIDGFYKKGSDNIKLSTLKKLAAYFHCSLDYLVDDNNYLSTPITMSAHFDGDEYTEAELEDIRNYAEFIKHKRTETKQSKTSQFPNRSYLDPVAAHNRTDISDDSRTDELKKLEASIMGNEDEWK